MVAAGLTHVVSLVFERASGVALDAGIGLAEIGFAVWIIALGALLAGVPAGLVYRQPVVDALRGA